MAIYNFCKIVVESGRIFPFNELVHFFELKYTSIPLLCLSEKYGLQVLQKVLTSVGAEISQFFFLNSKMSMIMMATQLLHTQLQTRWQLH